MKTLISFLMIAAVLHCTRKLVPATKYQAASWTWVKPDGTTCATMTNRSEGWDVTLISAGITRTFPTQALAENTVEPYCTSDDKTWK